MRALALCFIAIAMLTLPAAAKKAKPPEAKCLSTEADIASVQKHQTELEAAGATVVIYDGDKAIQAAKFAVQIAGQEPSDKVNQVTKVMLVFQVGEHGAKGWAMLGIYEGPCRMILSPFSPEGAAAIVKAIDGTGA